jgi:hypothetical protein
MGGRRFSRVAAVVALSVAAIPMGAGDAVGHAFTAPSQVTMNYSGNAFRGEVVSQRTSCKRNRQVKLFKQKNGPDQLIATDTTNNNGNWRINRPQANGNFYAKIERRVQASYAHHHECGGDTSNVKHVD